MIPEFLTVIEISLPAYFRLRHGQQVKIEDSEIRTGPSSQYGRWRWRGHWVWLRGFRAVCDLLCRHPAAQLSLNPRGFRITEALGERVRPYAVRSQAALCDATPLRCGRPLLLLREMSWAFQ